MRPAKQKNLRVRQNEERRQKAEDLILPLSQKILSSKTSFSISKNESFLNNVFH